MLMIEDISTEKRMKSTMSRYMDPASPTSCWRPARRHLGGKSASATVLFSDMRGFTTITEELGAHGTVSLLNEYFTLMVDCISASRTACSTSSSATRSWRSSALPLAHDDDEDRAVRAAIAMINELRELERRAHRRRPEARRHRHRPQHRQGGVGQYRFAQAHGLHDDRRRREPRLAPGKRLQAVRRAHPDQREHRAASCAAPTASAKSIMVVVKGKTEPVGVYRGARLPHRRKPSPT